MYSTLYTVITTEQQARTRRYVLYWHIWDNQIHAMNGTSVTMCDYIVPLLVELVISYPIGNSVTIVPLLVE